MCEEARFSEVKSPSDVHFCLNQTIASPSSINLRLAVTMVVSELQNKPTAKRQTPWQAPSQWLCTLLAGFEWVRRRAAAAQAGAARAMSGLCPALGQR